MFDRSCLEGIRKGSGWPSIGPPPGSSLSSPVATAAVLQTSLVVVLPSPVSRFKVLGTIHGCVELHEAEVGAPGHADAGQWPLLTGNQSQGRDPGRPPDRREYGGS